MSEPIGGGARGDYLWFRARVAEQALLRCPELRILEHGLQASESSLPTLTVDAAGERDRWRLLASWAGGATPAADEVSQQVAREGTGLEIAEAAYGLVHRGLMAEAHSRGYSRIHAALLELDGRRIALAGASGAGKTTLAIRLAGHGAAVHSDEGVLIRAGLALGLPRRLHVKATGFGSLPRRLAAQAVKLGYEPPVYAIDPTRLGETTRPTVLTERPLDALVILGDVDGPTRLGPVAPQQALWSLLGDAANYASAAETLTTSRSRLMRELARLLSSTPVYRLDGYRGADGVIALRSLQGAR